MDNEKSKDLAVGILLILGSILVLAANWYPPGSVSGDAPVTNEGVVPAAES